MLFGRFLGDWLKARFGAALLIRGGAILSLSGLAVAILFPVPLFAILGFALVGLGLANIVPIVYSTSGKIPGLPSGVGIASVSTIGYSGFLIGPPIIGFIADFQNELLARGNSWLLGIQGLRVGLSFVLLLMLVLLLLSIFVLRFQKE
jgi:MFS family permease